MTLCCGLVPSAAFAADDSSLSLIPEGEQGVASIASSAEGGDADGFSHYASDDAPSADGSDAAIPSEDVIDFEGVAGGGGASTEANGDDLDEGIVGDGASATIPATDLDIINRVEPLQVVAESEATKSYFLAQTLESTRTVPMVSASVPIDTGAGDDFTGEGSGNPGELDAPVGIVAADSTVVGSFEYLGMTFVIEPGGESVALVAADYSKLPQEFIEKQVLVIPETTTPDGIDYYSVTRIVDNAFSGFTAENANPNYTGCETLFSDETLLTEAGIDAAEAADENLLAGCLGILAVGIPASVTSIEDGAFAGFETLQYIVVSEGNFTYGSFDGGLYNADFMRLLVIPEGRIGALCVMKGALYSDVEIPSSCSLVDSEYTDDDSISAWLDARMVKVLDTADILFAPDPSIFFPVDRVASAADGSEFNLGYSNRCLITPSVSLSFGYVLADVVSKGDGSSCDAMYCSFDHGSYVGRTLRPITLVKGQPYELWWCPNGYFCIKDCSSGDWYHAFPSSTFDKPYSTMIMTVDAMGGLVLAVPGQSGFRYFGNDGIVSGDITFSTSAYPYYVPVAWNLDGGSCSELLPSGTGPGHTSNYVPIVTLPDSFPTKDGFVFKGWTAEPAVSGGTLSEDGRYLVSGTVHPSRATTFTAQWEEPLAATGTVKVHFPTLSDNNMYASAYLGDNLSAKPTYALALGSSLYYRLDLAGTTKIFTDVVSAEWHFFDTTRNMMLVVKHSSGTYGGFYLGSGSNYSYKLKAPSVQLVDAAGKTSEVTPKQGAAYDLSGQGLYVGISSIPGDPTGTTVNWVASNGGTNPGGSSGVLPSSSLTAPTPSKGSVMSAFTFVGWEITSGAGYVSSAKNSSGTNASSPYPAGTVFKFTGVGSVTFTAKWTRPVTFDARGGTVNGKASDTITATKSGTTNSLNASYTAPTPVRGNGWIFDKWTTSSTSVDAGTISAGSKTDAATNYYARWRVDVSYDGNGGTVSKSSDTVRSATTSPYNGTLKLPAAPTAPSSGKTFAGWEVTTGATYVSAQNGTSAPYAAETDLNVTGGASGILKFKAVWDVIKSYTIEWDGNGASSYTPDAAATSQVYGSAIVLPKNDPQRWGYAFDDWWTEDEGGTQVGAEGGVTTVPAHDAKYFAHWKKQTGKITFLAYGASDADHADAKFTEDQVSAYNEVAGHPVARFKSSTEIELEYDVDTASFSLSDVNLKPSLAGSKFSAWDPSVGSSFDPKTTTLWSTADEVYAPVTYTATWDDNVYEISYQDRDGHALDGWTVKGGGELLETFNEATPEADRILPEMEKRGYRWLGWLYDGKPVTSIPDAHDDIVLVGDFETIVFDIAVDYDGGDGSAWHEGGFTATYDAPSIELPSDDDGDLKKAGYAFSHFEAYVEDGTEPVTVYGQDASGGFTEATAVLLPGNAYKVVDLGAGEDVYDVILLKAVWEERIGVDVSASVKLGVLADMVSNELRFRCNETSYQGTSSNVFAPVVFTSYTTAPLGIAAVTDDADDAGYDDRKALAAKAFSNKDGQVKLSLSAAEKLEHLLNLGGSTAALPVGMNCLSGLVLAPADDDGPTQTTLYLGMHFGNLTASDLDITAQGDIAKLYYTVALLDDDVASTASKASIVW